MPTYDYICQSCSEEFEIFQSIKEAPLKKCPKCKRQRLKRLIGTGAGILFKGSGFYETDYKRPPKKDEKASGNGSKQESPAKKGEKSSDTSKKTSESPAKSSAAKT